MGKRAALAGTAGDVLQLVRDGEASSRSEIARATGLARSTVSQRVDSLIAAGLLIERGDGQSTGGRRPTVLELDATGGVVLAADFGATHCHLAIADRTGSLIADADHRLDIGDGPDRCLAFAIDALVALLESAGQRPDAVEGIGVGLPGPVEFAAGRVVSPPIMPGWDGVPVAPYFADRFPSVPVLVDNDVNVMAIGEYAMAGWRDTVDNLLFVKVGTGIGCGIVANGVIHRGAQGAAGDLGHVPVSDGGDVLCHCGNLGCVEAVASGAALATALRQVGIEAATTADVVALARAGHPTVVPMVRTAGRRLGEVLAGAVNFFNPSVIVLGGGLDEAHEHLIAGVREVIYQRSTSLATHDLDIVRSRLSPDAGVVGCAVMVLDQILSPSAVDARVADSRPRASEVAVGG